MNTTLLRRYPWLVATALLALGCPGSGGADDDDDGDGDGDGEESSDDGGTAGTTGDDDDDDDDTGTTGGGEQAEWKELDVYIELTEDDIEVQTFIDGSRWNDLQIIGPDGTVVFELHTAGNMAGQGLSEIKLDGNPDHFPIVGDPAHMEIEDIDVFLADFPAGTYTYEGLTVDGVILSGQAELTHDLPAEPEILSPADLEDPETFPLEGATIEWEPVTEGLEGGPIDIASYEIIVEQVEPFRKLSIFLPPSATTLAIPSEFLEADAVYEVEVLAIEASHNQTISVAEFRTSDTAEAPEDPPPDPDAWYQQTFFIELTEDDIEVQTFVDGPGAWTGYEIVGPSGDTVVSASTGGNMATQGLSELKIDGSPSHFPIVGDPEHVEIEDIDVFLADFPAGTYAFAGVRMDGGALSGNAELTHALPALPVITTPADAEEPEVLDLDAAVIEWESVVEAYQGGALEVVQYEVIVEAEEPESTIGGLNIHLPGTATSLTIPPQFLAPDVVYEVEVIAIEASHNQSIAVAEFEVQ